MSDIRGEVQDTYYSAPCDATYVGPRCVEPMDCLLTYDAEIAPVGILLSAGKKPGADSFTTTWMLDYDSVRQAVAGPANEPIGEGDVTIQQIQDSGAPESERQISIHCRGISTESGRAIGTSLLFTYPDIQNFIQRANAIHDTHADSSIRSILNSYLRELQETTNEE